MMSLLIMGSTAVMVGAINNILGFVVILMYLIMMFKHDMDWFMSYGEFMLDSVSFLLIVLSVWISMFMYMAMSMGHYFSKLLSAVIASLLLLLMFAFASVNFILFYVFFEACLLPTLILILGWGYQPERTNAGTYMIIYTVVGSLPLLWSLLFMKSCGVVFMTSNISINIDSFLGVLLFIACFVAFLIKLPVYMVHLWLPKAHVEAPVGGSMILAGLLLKLGGYGLMRVSLVISKMPTFCLLFIMGWALFGGVVVSVLCLQQSDIKSLIALSSVVHMAMIVGGVCVQSSWGIKSALLIMVGHGLCSSGLFCAANLIYKWVGSRSISVVGGLQSSVPALSLFWFLLCSSNMSAPPSLSLLGEISGGVSIVSWSWWFSSIMFMLVLMSGAYSLFLYLSVTHGKPGSTIMGCGFKLGDMLLLGLHWGLLNIIFLIELNCVMSM